MSRALALICVVLLTAGLVAMAGCESSGFNDVDLDEPIAEGIQTNFVDEAGNLIAFTQFGTFKLVVDDELLEGNYNIVAG